MSMLSRVFRSCGKGSPATRSFVSLLSRKSVADSSNSVSRIGFRQGVRLFSQVIVDVPSLGDSISEGTIIELCKNVGESVKVDDVVMVIETDKVTVDVRAPSEGVVTDMSAALEEEVVVGQKLFTLDSSAEATVTPSAPKSASAPSAPETQPAVEAVQTHSQREPLIRMRYGRCNAANKPASPAASISKAAPAKKASTQASSQAYSSPGATVVELDELPADLRPRTLLDFEMDVVESGGASMYD
eukprot:517162_1